MRLLPVVLVLSAGVPACAGAPSPDSAADWTSRAARLEAADPAARFVQAAGRFLGTPYVNGPLGEGEGAAPDPDPRVDFAHADCVTYLEQALALAIADPSREESFLRALDAIRYERGEVSFSARNHYMVRDWIPANAWLLRDVTADVGAGRVRTVRRTIDRAAFLRDQGVEPRAGVDDARELAVDIVPSEAAAEVAPALRSGDLVFWVGRTEGIFVLHTGLVARGADGGLSFRHASSKAGHALDEPFLEYAERATFAQGFIVLRLRDDAALAAAPGGAK